MVICLALNSKLPQPWTVVHTPPLGSIFSGSAFRKSDCRQSLMAKLNLINLKDENMEKLNMHSVRTQLPQHWPPNIS